jgi:hypothetical protein
MNHLCHRCRNSIRDEAHFCPECGAPQLTVELPEPESAQGLAGSVTAAHGGARAGGDHGWAAAVTIAGTLGVPVGVLGSLLPFGSLWVLVGSMYATVLFRKRTHTRASGALAVRMGAVLGLFAALAATAGEAAKLLVTRYVLHRGAEIDTELHTVLQGMVDRMLAANPEASSQMGWFRFWLSPDGPAALVVCSAVFSAVLMVAFAALGGMLGARYLRPRQAS